MLLAHKIALDPTPGQVAYFRRACGAARFAWNWALARWQQEYALWREYRCGPKPTEAALRRELTLLKDTAFPWLREVAHQAPKHAIRHLGQAFAHFFQGRAGYPKFKKKGIARDSFRADDGTDAKRRNAVVVAGTRVKLPVVGWVRMRESLRFTGAIKAATVTRKAERWFVSLVVDIDHTPPIRQTQAVGGVDLGIKQLATLSDGSVIEGPKALAKNLKKLRQLSRAVSRKQKGSANRRKAVAKLARCHERIGSIRADALHKATTAIVRTFDVIGIEDLGVANMLKHPSLARSIADMGAFEFRRQLTYKAARTGARVVVASRRFPSSRLCSACGARHAGLTLAEREWRCAACGVRHDRDRNAALNLQNYAAGSAVSACGADRAGPEPLGNGRNGPR